jgi:hypothetical protein
MSFLASVPINAARVMLQDVGAVAYSDALMGSLLADGMRLILKRRPESADPFSPIRVVSEANLTVGVRQLMSFYTLLDVTHVADQVTNAVLKGLRRFDMGVLSQQRPNWRAETPGVPIYWMYDDVEPGYWYCYPPAKTGLKTELQAIRSPEPSYAPAQPIYLRDDWQEPLAWYITARAMSAELTHAERSKADYYMGTFAAYLEGNTMAVKTLDDERNKREGKS